MLGNPVRVHRELQGFRRAAHVLSSRHRRLIQKYPNQWVAVYHDDVIASGATLDAVLKEVAKRNVPKEHTIVHFVEKNQRTMILCSLCLAGASGKPADGRTLKPR